MWGEKLKGKTTQKKKSTTRRKKTQNAHVNEIKGIFVFALGILMLLSFYVKDSIGIFGTFIREVSLGLFGVPAFLIPPVIILYAAALIFGHEKLNLKNKALYIFFLFLLVSAMIQAGNYRSEYYKGLKPLKALEMFYVDGNALVGGGILGGLISMPFLVTFKVLGTFIILTALALVDTILLTNSSISVFIKNLRSLLIRKVLEAKSKNIEDEEDYMQPSIVEDGEEMSLRFDKKPKVIDFKIEKTNRELKEKEKEIGMEIETEAYEDDIFPEQEETPIELVIGDLKKETGKKRKTPARPKNENNEPGLQEIVIKGPVPKNSLPSNYRVPPYDLLIEDADMGGSGKSYRNQVLEGAKKLEETLNSFGVSAKVINVTRGPTVTRYELQPSAGVKVSKIVNLSDDIALNLAAPGIRIEAPIPGKAAIGIEVPNK